MHFKNDFNKLLGQTTIYQLSKATGIERTKLQRIKTGKRLPNYRDIDSISKAMMFTPDQKENLKKSLTLDLIGEDRYKNRNATKQFLYDLNAILNRENSVRYEFHASYELTVQQEPIITNTVYDTKNIISAVLKAEANDNDEIYILSNNDDFIFKQLHSVNGNLKVKHLLTFKQNNNSHYSYSYNINTVSNIFSLFLENTNYSPYFMYENAETSLILPYSIITNHYLINFSSDYSNAIVTKSKQIIEKHKELFDKTILNCNVLIKKNTTIFEYSEIYLNSIPKIVENNDVFYSFEYEPCIIPYMGAELLNKYMYHDFKGADEIKNRVLYVINQYQKAKQKSFFTEEGINHFLQTGRIIEIPDFVYKPFSLLDRKLILQKICNLAETSGSIMPHLIKKDKIQVPKNLRYWGAGDSNDFFVLKSDHDHPNILQLNNCELALPFYDFVSSLENSEDVYSVAETIRFIQEKIGNI